MDQTARMNAARLTWSADVAVADWIGPRLGPFGGWVGSVVPRGFQAYARVHPIDSNRTWADVCVETGAHAHALMQWNEISRRQDRTGRTDGEDPREGDLVFPALELLCRALQPLTGDQRCWFALWEGYGWINGAVAGLRREQTRGFGSRERPAQTLDNPKVVLPNRAYHLFSGELTAALTMGWDTPQSPSLFWPADRSWCVATEIDFDSTLVGGTRALIDGVMASALEVWEVRPNDLLAYDADLFNAFPGN